MDYEGLYGAYLIVSSFRPVIARARSEPKEDILAGTQVLFWITHSTAMSVVFSEGVTFS